jgi:hypothetical protein
MVVALVFFVLAGIFIFNFFRLNADLVEGHIKQGIIPNLTQGRFNLNFGTVSGNLINGVELENVQILNPHFESGATIMTVPRVSMNYSLWGIFWGNITLQKLHIENPVLTLKRNELGRGIWDFSKPEEQAKEKNDKKNLTTWQRQEQARALADNYLTDITVDNLSILIPSPDQLITDEFMAKLTSFPTKTYQFSNIDLKLKKYPAEKFVSHIFSVSMPDDPDFLRFQFTRTRSNGNFTLSFDAVGQNFNFAVENLGLDGRRINFYDGRMKDRLNLEWVWARNDMSLLERVRGLKGVLKIPDFSDIFKPFLAKDSHIKGKFELAVNTVPGEPLYNSDADLQVSDFSLKIPFFPVIQKLDAVIETANRVARIENIALKIKDILSQHSGVVNYVDSGNISGNLQSDIMGDKMQIDANYKRITPGLHSLDLGLERNSGKARVEFKRHRVNKNIIYRDFKVKAGLVKDGKAVEILPLNLMPEDITNKMLAWFNRIELIGPFNAETSFETIEDWQNSELDISFNGAKIVNKNNPVDYVQLYGKAGLASYVLSLTNLQAGIDNFALNVDGKVKIATQTPFIKNYNLDVKGGIEGKKSFKITAARLQKSLGLKYKPDFDSIELKGNNLLNADIASDKINNFVKLDIDTFKFWRNKQPLWCNELEAEVRVNNRFNIFASERPGPTEASLAGKFFGIPIKALLKADISKKTIDKLDVKGGGSDFSKIIEAIISQPEGERFFKKYPLTLSGAFNFAFLGEGLLTQPDLQGWVKFPRLSFSYSDVFARLPFHAMVKTSDNSYHADIKAGKASLKVGKVKFDLGKTSLKAEVENLFKDKDPKVKLKADSKVFATSLSADGALHLSSKKIESMNLALKSSKIEILANEIARIGQFAIPFDIAGRFNATARLYGNLFSPDSKGKVEVANISLDFPLFAGLQKGVLAAKNFSGKANFSKKGSDFFELELKNLKGHALGADLDLDGKAHLKRQKKGFKPYIDQLNAKLTNLKAPALANYLIDSFLPPDIADALSVVSGEIFGKFTLKGNADKLVALGEAQIVNTSIGYAALKDQFKNFKATLKFEGRSDKAYARVGVEDASAQFGRSVLKIKNGYLEDPLRTGQILLEGAVERLYPKDLLSMFGGMNIDALSFPKEGWLDGNLRVTGTMFAPVLQSQVRSSAMKVAYRTESTVYTIPIGQNMVSFLYNPANGKADIIDAELSLLNGTIKLNEARGVFSSQKPFSFNLKGDIEGVDIGSLKLSDQDSFRGVIDGKLQANWEPEGARDAVFNLEFKDIFIPKIPVVDPKTIDGIGIDFVKQPDFRQGKLNFYVTTEEDPRYAGKLLVADGLFAGPHMRVVLGNSEFNPMAMKLDGRLWINPQSLRKTKIGRKMGKLSAQIQDKKTGLPYIDLDVTGTWDKPELMAKEIQKRAERRGKRNFLGQLFSGGPHKASVQELMQWFPGWKKGM